MRCRFIKTTAFNGKAYTEIIKMLVSVSHSKRQPTLYFINTSHHQADEAALKVISHN